MPTENVICAASRLVFGNAIKFGWSLETTNREEQRSESVCYKEVAQVGLSTAPPLAVASVAT